MSWNQAKNILQIKLQQTFKTLASCLAVWCSQKQPLCATANHFAGLPKILLYWPQSQFVFWARHPCMFMHQKYTQSSVIKLCKKEQSCELIVQEDSFTSTSIVRAGWKAIYIPDCLAMGLSPPTLSGALYAALGLACTSKHRVWPLTSLSIGL